MAMEDNLRDLDRLRSVLDPFVRAHAVLGEIIALEEEIMTLSEKKAQLEHDVANEKQILLGHQAASKALADAQARV